MRINRVISILLAALLCMTIMLGGCTATTQKNTESPGKYPAKPITLIVPFAAGGGTDIMARALEKSSQQYFGQPFIIVNKPGGGGTIGMNEIAGGAPDGYIIGTVGLNALLQPLYGETRYHYPTALEPLVKVSSSPAVLAVLSEKPWKNLNDLVNDAKAHPGKIKFGHAGLGTPMHITGEMFAKEAGINVVQVPFKGDSEALAALLGGHVHFITGNLSALKEHVKSNTIKILGLAEENRSNLPGLENIPTFKEQGINVAFNFWNGIVAPKGIPAQEKARLTAGLQAMINTPEFRKDMEQLGMVVDYLGPQEFTEQWNADNVRLGQIVKETGIAEKIASQKK